MSTMKTSSNKKDSFRVEHEFVEFIPDKLAERTLYVSIPYASAAHSCFCGCGIKVVTPINPTGWELRFDGDTVSLRPSIGNWGFPCRSHYWIKRNRVIWAKPMSREAIEEGRRRDQKLTAAYFGQEATRPEHASSTADKHTKKTIREWFFRR